MRNVIHTLAHGDMNGDRPDAAEKTVPSYIGFHASLHREVRNLVGFFTIYFHVLQSATKQTSRE